MLSNISYNVKNAEKEGAKEFRPGAQLKLRSSNGTIELISYS
jgi:hypothetical protein